ncbi:peptide-methionine (S)-S-oxide reductase MsrA [Buchananella hordeovulneris]|uniref:peptide-methionine (S)-S-oxide reductase MsrA n=1 Tax=Buchananella hordeovulneris TaxID=52770 RepID=UPI000F5F8B8C|nr:peptide-methionine (S)-S-oxide reductase MsrA [Buchananella hordeovulneris]RRD42982.1 peptide-methionine (S)-S-oxide reductase MsrA [Buchananella hordeovulneris]RRD51045.1 peptide-methionine (S)-S-oxide reductase MsrA [Buchananella hordeovulneris]
MNFLSLTPATPGNHTVLGTPLTGPWPAGSQVLHVAMGCFWGAEKLFWQLPGVVNTAVGYMGGTVAEPTYRQVCNGNTGHAEVVRIVFDPDQVTLSQLLTVFWENHDPTQGNRQGNDIGEQYRSAIFYADASQEEAARASAAAYAPRLAAAGYGPITTQIAPATEFWLAEDYHQQYLDKNPAGYCPVHATGVTCQ